MVFCVSQLLLIVVLTTPAKFRPNPHLRLMDQVREVLRFHHYALQTERTYVSWILRYIRFYHCRVHPKEMGWDRLK